MFPVKFVGLAAVGLALLPRTAIAAQSTTSNNGMVASANALASQVGVDVMKRGGNAVDAACSVALALAVVYPAAGNLGGGGFMLIRLANGRTAAIDYREEAPVAASRNMYLDKEGNVVPNESLIGYLASGVPGTVAGLALAHRKYGKLPWQDVVQPAIDLASNGFVVSNSLASALHANVLSRFPESRRIFQRGGDYYREGEIFRQPDLAATLQRIAKEGPNDFYNGRTAQLIADSMKDHGLITLKDLSGYRAEMRKPLTGRYRGYDVITMPPPSSGGIALLETLNMLEPYDIEGAGFATVRGDHLMAEAMRRAFADRAEFLGDPDFVHIPVKGLVSKSYAETEDKTIADSAATPSAVIGHGNPAPYESHDTTHFSVVDSAGNAVANTYTLNFGFGSGFTVPGAGFLMNDEMDDFASKPGVPNGFGLIQGEGNAIAPRKRPLSSMTPTILVKDGKLALVTGSPGGPTIISTVIQVIVNVIDHQMTLEQAVAAPRIHHQWLPDLLDTERGAVTPEVRAELEANGYKLSPQPKYGNHRWGDAESIAIDPKTGTRIGVSDPRSPDAKAIGY